MEEIEARKSELQSLKETEEEQAFKMQMAEMTAWAELLI